MQNRLRVLSSIFILGFLLLVTRLFYWQIIKSKDLSIKAREQHQMPLVEIFWQMTVLG